MSEVEIYLVQIVVLTDQLLQLRLHVDNPLGREFKLDDGHPGLLEVLEETHLGRLQEQQTTSLAVGTSRRTTDAVDVVARIIGRIVLDDPVHRGDLMSRLDA